MGSNHYLSDSLEILADRMAEIIRAERRKKNSPFLRGRIFIPNRNLRRWLQLRLSETGKATVMLEFEFLETGLFKLLQNLDLDERKPELLDRTELRFRIFHILREEHDHATPQDPIHEYLSATGKGSGSEPSDSPLKMKRMYHLSEKLAGLFQDYEYHRNAMIASWHGDATEALDIPGEEWPLEDDFKKYEEAQKRIYRKAIPEYDPKGKTRKMPLWLYAREVFQKQAKKATGKPEEHVHIFAMSRISRLHLAMIEELSRYYQIHAYILETGPMRPGDLISAPAKDWQEFLPETSEKSGSRRLPGDDWNRPAMEMIELLRKHSTEGKWYRKTRSSETNSGLLPLLQRSFRERHLAFDSKEVQNAIHEDRENPGLVIAGAPGPYREAETIYQAILYLLKKHPDLQFTDIAILVPNMKLYRPALQSVFERRVSGEKDGRLLVPYNLTDFSAGETSFFARGVETLLSLVNSSFTRKEVFSLFSNPCFQEARKVDEAMVQVWLHWAENLGVFRDYDSAQKRKNGLLEDGRFTWKEGMLRLWLGQLLENPEKNRRTPWNDIWPYADMESSSEELLSLFSASLEQLRSDILVLEIETEERNGESWAQITKEIIRRHLKPPADRPGEESVQNALFSAMDRLADLSPEPLTFEIIAEYILSHLKEIPGNRGSYLTEGVTIAALQPMRPIPFRYIFVPGLTEGDFPGSHVSTFLDLRNFKRRTGDVNMPEGNRLLFLETLLSATDGIYLLFTDQDLQKDRRYEPCSPVGELRSRMRRLGFEAIDTEERRTAFPQVLRLPLRSDDPEHLAKEREDPSGLYSSHFPEDRQLALQTLEYRKTGSVTRTEDRETPPESSLQSAGNLRITLSQLAGMLRDPLGACLLFRTGLQDQDLSDPAMREDEPFYSEFPSNFFMIRKSLHRSFATKAEGSDVPLKDLFYLHLSQEHKTGRQRSLLPVAAFGERDLHLLFEKESARINALENCDEGLPQGFIRIGNGATETGLKALFSLPAISFAIATEEGETSPVHLEGDSPPIRIEGNRLYIYQLTSKSELAYLSFLARPFIFSLALRASGISNVAGLDHFALVFDSSGKPAQKVKLPDLLPGAAEAILKHLASHLCFRPYFHIPASLAFHNDLSEETVKILQGKKSPRYREKMIEILSDLATEYFPPGSVLFAAEKIGIASLVPEATEEFLRETLSPYLRLYLQEEKTDSGRSGRKSK